MLAVKINHNRELIGSRCVCAQDVVTEIPAASATPSATREKNSYGQILKSSALIGGSQVANIAIGIVRTKAMAMLLGPAGFGLFGLYGSIQNLTQSIAGMGINSSGVRQIAASVGTGDDFRVAQTAAVLRKTSIVLGLLGAVLLTIFSHQISRLTFGSIERASAVALLSLAVLFGLVSAAQGALIQGMRRIGDLAKMNVLGAFLGAIISIPMVYLLREKGVVPSLVAVALMAILTSSWYSRKIEIQPTKVTFSEVREEAAALLKLGSAFMASGLLTMGVAYAVRIMVLRRLGLEATGLYQSAWTLGGLYVGFILQAMGADFYPRLTASINDHTTCNRLVNEQTRVGLLLAGPGVLATLTFAPLVIALFYTAKFGAAVEILRWICLGAMLQVMTWPMGFVIVAKGNQTLFFLAELAWAVVATGLAWGGVRFFGLTGAGIAFFSSYVFHGLLIYPIVRQISGFRWSRENKQTGLILLSLTAVVFYAFHAFPFRVAIYIGALAVVLTGAYSIRVLATLISLDQVPPPLRRLLAALGSGTSTLRQN
jgi:enterobacterial common antigen flippase